MNHFGSLKKEMTISDKLLALQLNDLVEDGIITKTSIRDNPLLTNYQLTSDGLRLYKIIGLLEQWGNGYKQFISSKTGLVNHKPHLESKTLTHR
jgi:DNA-binding HxlR family transcriptional regulator